MVRVDIWRGGRWQELEQFETVSQAASFIATKDSPGNYRYCDLSYKRNTDLFGAPVATDLFDL